MLLQKCNCKMLMMNDKMNSNSPRKDQVHPPCKRRLEAKIIESKRDVRLLTELQKGVDIKKQLLK